MTEQSSPTSLFFLCTLSTPLPLILYLVLLFNWTVEVQASTPQTLPSNHKTLEPLSFYECMM